ncbi:DJ-1/PfpI family protein [Leptospira sp. 2 VSF19]|uniref:DJ-1/PfpI family protein n=1 Tax=Leptospira soteropolitanensis TaxID=2950025 RepID=A0AAW5VN99_9LEPT|nr:DJ-1/PfpI family protein [Leptospira soteropolitanensis]MCW7493531.1 DJ-1/PfpI family protein [Leptospira soteropolitanensis]MCW7500937.1 DJ-1/PfpI family protein [Leptospira soteropolitanensis]MCW7523383.1 DJ-1/PfpI family protein [Leptospira soteropolitanensis]MCW7527244.1 DJ-1/PfpI family protein [Leptospira soteropolitanensis]MCW7531101.1 DJ-1/PfpI family protein [Leptospira soteropolitanensis]
MKLKTSLINPKFNHKNCIFPSLNQFTFFMFVFLSLNLWGDSPVGNEDQLKVHLNKPNHKIPIVVVIGENQYTELTDFIVPYGILKRSHVAKVYAIAEKKGKIDFFPALSMEINSSLKDFNNLHPEGADLVIVPAIHNAKNETIIRWIQTQYNSGATIVGICDGVWTLGYAGLLKNKNVTGHWYSKEKLSEVFPDSIWHKNKRYIQDERIITTSGVTASIPISLALVESIGGRKKAEEMAQSLGIRHWDSQHNTDEFNFDWKQYLTAAKNLFFFWDYDTIEIPVYEGIDEISLALVADVYSRTYQSKAITITYKNKPSQSKSGIKFISELIEEGKKKKQTLFEITEKKKAFEWFEQSLSDVEKRYGLSTKRFVKTQLEFPGH